MTKDIEEFSQFKIQWLVVSTLCREMKNYLTRKVGFKGTPNWARVRSHNQLAARQIWSGKLDLFL